MQCRLVVVSSRDTSSSTVRRHGSSSAWLLHPVSSERDAFFFEVSDLTGYRHTSAVFLHKHKNRLCDNMHALCLVAGTPQEGCKGGKPDTARSQ